MWFVVHCIGSAVELPSKEVQRELDEIQRQLSEFLTAEESAMKERIRCELFRCHRCFQLKQMYAKCLIWTLHVAIYSEFLLFTGTVPPNRNERNEVQDTHYNWHTFIVMMTSQQYSTKDLMRVANYILHVLSDCSSKGVLQERLFNCTVSVTLHEAQLINHCQSCVDRLIKLETQCHLVPGTCRILTIWLTGRQSSVRVKLTLTDGWGFFERASC